MADQYVTLQELPKFKRAYNKAVKESKDIFDFEGRKVLTKYAKYLIEYYLELENGKSKRN